MAGPGQLGHRPGELLSESWHVLHFIGHGDYDPTTDEGLIALVGQEGRPNLVGAERLADLLNEAHPTPRLVVLNSCSSGEEGTQDLFSGTAAGLVRSGISAVAAMQFTISDTAAIAFAKGFYTAIAHGHTIDDATRSGRISILGAGGTLEWVTPVLYVRGDTTELFDVSKRSPRPAPPAPARSISHPRERAKAPLRQRLTLRSQILFGATAVIVIAAIVVAALLLLRKPPPPPPVAHGVITDTCDEGGSCGVKQRDAPYTGAKSLVPHVLQDDDRVDLVCQTDGDSASNKNHGNSNIWYRLSNGAYVNSVYVKIQSSERIPPCTG